MTERERELEKMIASIESELRQRNHERTLVIARSAAFSGAEMELTEWGLCAAIRDDNVAGTARMEIEYPGMNPMHPKAVY